MQLRVTVIADETVTVGPLVNPRVRGAILVTKTRKHAADGPGDHPHEASCAEVPFRGENVAFHNTPLSTITISFFSQVPGGTVATQISCTGLTDSDPDPASATFTDLVPGTYNCTVVVDP